MDGRKERADEEKKFIHIGSQIAIIRKEKESRHRERERERERERQIERKKIN